MKQKTQQGFTHLIIITIVLVLVTVGCVSYVVWQNLSKTKSTPTALGQPNSNTEITTPKTITPTTTTPTVPTADTHKDPTSGWKTFSGTYYDQDISFKYPTSWPSITQESYSGILGSSPTIYYIEFCPSENAICSTISVRRAADAYPGSLEQARTSLTNGEQTGHYTVKFTDLTIGGQPALKAVFGESTPLEQEQGVKGAQFTVIYNGVYFNFNMERPESEADTVQNFIDSVRFS